jgi:predicted nucleotidyltransferase
MSGSFVQRGEPAIVDKWTRARMAIDSGVDLVLELPFVFSTQSAEIFSYGAVRLLDATNSVSHLAFGSEEGKVDILEPIAKLLVTESEDFSTILKKNLSSGLSFSSARSLAVSEILGKMGHDQKLIEETISKPNNILGIEYLKALIRLKSSIRPVTFMRKGHGYKDTSTNLGIASATAIRQLLLSNDFSGVEDLLPEISYSLLLKFFSEYKTFNYLDNYSETIKYVLRLKSAEELSLYMDMETGLENRLKRISSEVTTAENLVERTTTKRYPGTRIRRLLVHILTDLKADSIKHALTSKPEYIRVLASNYKGFEIINEIKKNSDLKIITKFSDAYSGLSETSKAMLEKEVLATDLYYLGLRGSANTYGMDYLVSPYVLRK